MTSTLCCYNKQRDNRCLLPRFQDDLFCEEHRKWGYDHTVSKIDNPLPFPPFLGASRSKGPLTNRGYKDGLFYPEESEKEDNKKWRKII